MNSETNETLEGDPPLLAKEEVPVLLEPEKHKQQDRMVGKLGTQKTFNNEALFRTLTNVWIPQSEVSATAIDNGVFLFQFKNEKDFKRVLEGRPWHFENMNDITEEVRRVSIQGEEGNHEQKHHQFIDQQSNSCTQEITSKPTPHLLPSPNVEDPLEEISHPNLSPPQKKDFVPAQDPDKRIHHTRSWKSLARTGLSSLLKQAETTKVIHGIRFARSAPIITRLLFADDCLLFVRGTDADIKELKRILQDVLKLKSLKMSLTKYATRRWRVGNGQCIPVLGRGWIPGTFDNKAWTAAANITEQHRVADLIDRTTKQWKTALDFLRLFMKTSSSESTKLFLMIAMKTIPAQNNMHPSHQKRLLAPEPHLFKLNSIIAQDHNGRIGMGFIFRNSEGQAIICKGGNTITHCMSTIAEAIALCFALSSIQGLFQLPFTMETDSLQLIHAWNACTPLHNELGLLIEGAKLLSEWLKVCTVVFCPREANRTAQHLARLALNFSEVTVWRDGCP
ncbi:hypothetical protein Ancab_038131 [Ancistrocladus abbreviatus]